MYMPLRKNYVCDNTNMVALDKKKQKYTLVNTQEEGISGVNKSHQFFWNEKDRMNWNLLGYRNKNSFSLMQR